MDDGLVEDAFKGVQAIGGDLERKMGHFLARVVGRQSPQLTEHRCPSGPERGGRGRGRGRWKRGRRWGHVVTFRWDAVMGQRGNHVGERRPDGQLGPVAVQGGDTLELEEFLFAGGRLELAVSAELGQDSAHLEREPQRGPSSSVHEGVRREVHDQARMRQEVVVPAVPNARSTFNAVGAQYFAGDAEGRFFCRCHGHDENTVPSVGRHSGDHFWHKLEIAEIKTAEGAGRHPWCVPMHDAHRRGCVGREDVSLDSGTGALALVGESVDGLHD